VSEKKNVAATLRASVKTAKLQKQSMESSKNHHKAKKLYRQRRVKGKENEIPIPENKQKVIANKYRKV
jgi:hypothetical protein